MHPQISVRYQLKKQHSNQETSQIHHKSDIVAKKRSKNQLAWEQKQSSPLTPPESNRPQIKEAGERQVSEEYL